MYYLSLETLEIIFYLLWTQKPLNIGDSDIKDIIYNDFYHNEIDKFFNISYEGASSIIELVKPKELSDFFTKYLEDFMNDKLKCVWNVYRFDKQMSIMQEILEYNFERYGYRFTINSRLEEIDIENKDDIEKRGRILESLIILNCKELLTINYFNYITKSTNIYEINRPASLNLNITLKKSPAEMFDINKYWIHYGDIRINESDGIAFYKNNKYPFKSTYGKAFKLLCYLVKNHGQKLPIIETFDNIYPENKEITVLSKNKKAKIKDYVKEIKKNLKITEDANPSLDIMIIGDSVLLISNPPIN
jgi:hypothetical protein